MILKKEQDVQRSFTLKMSYLYLNKQGGMSLQLRLTGAAAVAN